MNTYFHDSHDENVIPILPISESNFEQWIKNQAEEIKNWTEINEFVAKPGTYCLCGAQGKLTQVLLGVDSIDDFWSYGMLSANLPKGLFYVNVKLTPKQQHQVGLGWALGAYQFTPYKKQPERKAKLYLDPAVQDKLLLEESIRAIYFVRDLINTPTDHLGPAELSEVVVSLAEEFNAEVTQIIGEDLLGAGFPSIHTVGRASIHAPRLIDLRWGDPSHPKVTLVGKGVCFDSGGLDIKSASGMAAMKKDMGGAAHVIGLSQLIMAYKLPIRLRLLVPAVENAVSGDAYHPGDVITTRSGQTVEVTNTDAEGRLVLCDAITEAIKEKPEVIIDFATLTGAGRVALGPEIPALFSNDEELANEVLKIGIEEQDLLWQLPLYQPYKEFLKSSIADMSNAAMKANGMGGAITAALFLQSFVPDEQPWLHFDLMAANMKDLPGRPEGGEAQGLRAVFHYLVTRYGK